LSYYMKIAGVTGGANYLGSDAWSNIDSVLGNSPSKYVLVTRRMDFVSVRLRKLAATRQSCPVVVIDQVETIGGANVLVMEMRLEQVILVYTITNASTQIESFELNYEKITLQYYLIQPRPTIIAVPIAPPRRIS
jgi:type VI protein secretion system component Hcp